LADRGRLATTLVTPAAMAIVSTAAAGLDAAEKATIIQLRDPAATVRRLESEATALVGRSPVPVVISSRCDVALASGAAGVNLPERDVSGVAALARVARALHIPVLAVGGVTRERIDECLAAGAAGYAAIRLFQ